MAQYEGVTEDLRKLQSLLDDGVITGGGVHGEEAPALDQPALPACESWRRRRVRRCPQED